MLDLLTTTLDHKDPEIETVEKSFQILPRTLGKGSFAKVNLAVHRKTKAQLAVKIMDRIRFGCPEKSGGTDINNEANILRAIDHANIVPVVDVIRTTRYMYIFMQMLPGGDLFDYIIKNGPLSEMEAKFAIYQILLALRHLHKQNISHRDLKPENILLTSATKYPRLLLTDFGMARDIGDTHVMKTMCGTFAYMAPEIFDVKHSHGAGYGTTADSWSLGITMYVVLSSTHPFTQNYANEEEVVMYRKVQSGALTFKSQIWTGLSSQVKDLIRGLLAKDPRTRWTVEKALDSDWIRNDLAWLRQKYRETTLSHWIKSTRHLRFVTLAGIDEGTTTPTTQQKSDRPEGIKRALSTYTEGSFSFGFSNINGPSTWRCSAANRMFVIFSLGNRLGEKANASIGKHIVSCDVDGTSASGLVNPQRLESGYE
ncbi:Checkpoint kinase 2 [Gryganskiella cystojenkinii]|nr:Checkpoint kinase 2 [Gryganskiella cystojenkinii]